MLHRSDTQEKAGGLQGFIFAKAAYRTKQRLQLWEGTSVAKY